MGINLFFFCQYHLIHFIKDVVGITDYSFKYYSIQLINFQIFKGSYNDLPHTKQKNRQDTLCV